MHTQRTRVPHTLCEPAPTRLVLPIARLPFRPLDQTRDARLPRLLACQTAATPLLVLAANFSTCLCANRRLQREVNHSVVGLDLITETKLVECGINLLDRQGSAIAHAKVTPDYVCIIPCVKAMAPDQTESDDQGRYEFKRLEYGRYSVSAEKPEENYPPLYLPFYSPEKQPEVDVSEANKHVTLDLVLTVRAGVLVGTVADSETGTPMDANVDFRSTTDSRRAVSASGWTTAKFRVLVPSDTPVLMKVSEPGYEDWFYTRNGVVVPIQLGPDETLKLEIRLKKIDALCSSITVVRPDDRLDFENL